ncbi:MAG: hypothetical protein R3Y07_00505 [Eubacteriales bacterium]
MQNLLLPLLALLFGGGGFGLRRYHLTHFYDETTMLYDLAAPPFFIILGLGFGLFLSFLLLVPKNKVETLSFEQVFLSPSGGFLYFYAMGGLLILAQVALTFLEFVRDPSSSLTFQIILASVLSVCSGISILSMAVSARRQTPVAPRLLATLPPFATLPYLVSMYQESVSFPQTTLHIFGLLGAISLTLAHYFICASLFEKIRPKLVIFFTTIAIFLNLTALAHLPSPTVFVFLAGNLCVLIAQSVTCCTVCQKLKNGTLNFNDN